MDKINILKLFKEQLGKNFMTPDVMNYTQFGNNVIELARGEGFEHEPIFGLTHREYDEKSGKFVEKGFSKMFFDENRARAVAIILKVTNGCKNITTSQERQVCGEFEKG